MRLAHIAIWVSGAWLAYALPILWLVYGRGAFQVVYEPVIGWIMGLVASNAECITIGARCYKYSAADVPTAARVKHETFHYTNQWRVYPLTFLPRYFYELIRYGYGCAPMEEAARAYGGEASECVK